jgi:hypothetical protein
VFRLGLIAVLLVGSEISLVVRDVSRILSFINAIRSDIPAIVTDVRRSCRTSACAATGGAAHANMAAAIHTMPHAA